MATHTTHYIPSVDGSPLAIEDIASHRNGICGEPFHVVTFVWQNRRMLATVFKTAGAVAILDRTKLEADDIAFGSNSWRGDRFEAALRAAIQASEAA